MHVIRTDLVWQFLQTICKVQGCGYVKLGGKSGVRGVMGGVGGVMGGYLSVLKGTPVHVCEVRRKK